MAKETIREFVNSLGWKIDEAGERRFVSAIEGATLRARLLGDAIEATARAVVGGVSWIATQFEQLFYQSQRLGASAQSIRAFEYAVSQLGGTAAGARSSLEGFGEFLRNTPHAREAIAKNLNIPLRETADTGKFLLDIGERLSHMPAYLANAYRDAYHIGDQQTLFAIERSKDALKFYDQSLGSQAGAGITGEAMQAATKFEQDWREVWNRIGTMAEGGESKLLTALTEPMQKFNDWLDKNSTPINDAIGKMADSVSHLTTAWVENIDKVKWPDVATKIDHAAVSFEHLAEGLAKLTVELTKDLPALQALLGALVGARVGSMFGPYGAAIGAGVGALAPGAIEQELDPNAPHAADTGIGGAIKGWWRSHAPGWLGGGSANYQDVPNAGNLTKLITEASKEAGIDPRVMEGIRAGESGHGGRYDVNNNPGTGDLSYGPFQLNKLHPGDLGSIFERDTAEERKRLGLGGLEDPRTIQMQARWIAQYIKRTGSVAPWAGFHGLRDADPRWGDSGYVPPKPVVSKAPVSWDVGPAMDALNAHLPVGPSSVDNSSRNVSSTVTNSIVVNAPDPHSAASMVGVHLDRSANDVSRNLQGAFQ